jgi:hypothetical protein
MRGELIRIGKFKVRWDECEQRKKDYWRQQHLRNFRQWWLFERFRSEKKHSQS